MKTKYILVPAMVAAATAAQAKITLTENIALEGFVDMSYVHWDAEEKYAEGKSKASDNSFTVDQAEIDFLFDFSPVTAQVDIQYLGGNYGDELELEQAFASYDLGNGGSVTAGRFVSMLGLESPEPTGLFQKSYAYQSYRWGDWSPIPGYNNGVKYTYKNDSGFFGIALQDAVWDRDDRFGGPGDSNWGLEIAGAFTGTENLTLFLGGAYERYEIGSANYKRWLVNGYAAYEADDWTFGAELNYGKDEDLKHWSALVMANFAYTEQASVTGRISYIRNKETLSEYSEKTKAWKLTAAHTYAFTDNLALVAELSYIDGENSVASSKTDYKELSGALQLLFKF